MKKFITIFVAGIFFSELLIAGYLNLTSDYTCKPGYAWGALQKVSLANEADNKKIWIFGDSTACRVYSNRDKANFLSFATVGGMTMLGHYWTFEKAIKKGLRPRAVVIMMRHYSWRMLEFSNPDGGKLDIELIIPFGSVERSLELTSISETRKLGARMLKAGLLPHQKLFSKLIQFFPQNIFFHIREEYGAEDLKFRESVNQGMSQVGIDNVQMIYLEKFIQLAEDNNIRVIIGQTYYSESLAKEQARLIKLTQKRIAEVAALHPGSVQALSIQDNVYPDQYFLEDKVHLKNGDFKREKRAETLRLLTKTVEQFSLIPNNG